MIDLLIAQCAVPEAPKEIIREIITVESAEDPFAINVNKLADALIPKSDDKQVLAKYIEGKIGEGYTVDVGLMQINSENFKTFGTDAISMLDECQNIAIGSQIFMKAYNAAVQFYGKTEKAKQTALSAYNTGTLHRGFTNGYVELYDETKPNPYKNLKVEIYDNPLGAQEKTDTDDPFESPMSVTIDFGSNLTDTALKQYRDQPK